MSFASDIADDFDVIDDIEVGSYERRTMSDQVEQTYTGVKAFKTATRGGIVSVGRNGQVTSDLCRWHIKVSTLAVQPRKGDRYVSTTEGTWLVISDDVECLGTEYVLTCRKVS